MTKKTLMALIDLAVILLCGILVFGGCSSVVTLPNGKEFYRSNRIPIGNTLIQIVQTADGATTATLCISKDGLHKALVAGAAAVSPLNTVK